MSRPALIAIGALLLILGALLSAIVVFSEVQTGPHARLAMIGIPSGLGGLLLALGFRYPYPASFRPRVARIAEPKRILVGSAMVVVSAALIYLFENAEGILGLLTLAVPDVVMIGALLGMPLGVLTAAAFLRDACARCRVALAEAPPSSGQSGARDELSFCERCNRVALLRSPGQAPRLFLDAEAEQVISRTRTPSPSGRGPG